MFHRAIAGLMTIVAIGGSTPEACAQDPSARCTSVANKRMTVASALSRGFDVENFSEVESVTFLQAFNAIPPKSDFVATKIFAAVGRDRAYIFFENGKDLCAPPTPMPRASYEALVEQARRDGT